MPKSGCVIILSSRPLQSALLERAVLLGQHCQFGSAQEAMSEFFGRLIVSHIGVFPLEPAIAELQSFYKGPLTVGADLQCTQAQ